MRQPIATLPWPDTGTLSTIASVIAAFSISMIFFRIQREVSMQSKGERNWIPWADCLLLFASFLTLLFVVLPLVAAHPTSWAYKNIPGPACATAIILVAFYPIAILAHYRFIFGNGRTGPRDNPEPGERWTVWIAIIVAIVTAIWSYNLRTN